MKKIFVILEIIIISLIFPIVNTIYTQKTTSIDYNGNEINYLTIKNFKNANNKNRLLTQNGISI